MCDLLDAWHLRNRKDIVTLCLRNKKLENEKRQEHTMHLGLIYLLSIVNQYFFWLLRFLLAARHMSWIANAADRLKMMQQHLGQQKNMDTLWTHYGHTMDTWWCMLVAKPWQRYVWQLLVVAVVVVVAAVVVVVFVLFLFRFLVLVAVAVLLELVGLAISKHFSQTVISIPSSMD